MKTPHQGVEGPQQKVFPQFSIQFISEKLPRSQYCYQILTVFWDKEVRTRRIEYLATTGLELMFKFLFFFLCNIFAPSCRS